MLKGFREEHFDKDIFQAPGRCLAASLLRCFAASPLVVGVLERPWELLVFWALSSMASSLVSETPPTKATSAELGILGQRSVFEGYGCAGASPTAYGLIAREERCL